MSNPQGGRGREITGRGAKLCLRDIVMKRKKAKYKKYIKLVIPKLAFDNLHYKLALVPPKFKYDVEVFYSILNDLSNIQYLRNHEDKNEMIPMASTLLKEKYGDDYAKYIRYLLNNSVIYGSGYSKGECTHYSLVINKNIHEILDNEGYYDSSYCFQTYKEKRVQAIGNELLNKASKLVKYSSIVGVNILTTGKVGRYILRQHNKNIDRIKHAAPHIRAMWQYYKTHLSIDYSAAIEHTERMFEYDMKAAGVNADLQNRAQWKKISRIRSIEDIHTGKYALRFTRGRTNYRLDTNLTNMAKDLRPFINGYSNTSYLDLNNSQPVLFNVILNKINTSKNAKLKNEIEEYRQMTLSGKWYEFLASLYGYDKKFDSITARSMAKQLWMLVAYSKNSTKFNKSIFKKRFPEIMKLIESKKALGHERFAIELQKMESRIFIDEISKELVEQGIIPYTFHDALMVPKEHELKAYQTMANILKTHLGAVPVISLNDEKIIPKIG